MPTLCPIAIVASCEKCPAFSVCPLKTVLGDHVVQEAPPEEAQAQDGGGSTDQPEP